MSGRRLYDENELHRALARQGLTRISEIGTGGMGAVLRAWDDAIGRWVAVKVITSFAAGDPENVRRFRGEMRLLGRIRHQAVVSVHTGHMSEHLAFFLMDYVPGGNLEQLIGQRRVVQKPFTVREVAHYLTPIADALDTIHAMSPAVTHRDIKPANILIPEDSPLPAVLTDFGISLVTGDARITSAEIVVGTEMYMAPERFDSAVGDGPAGSRADNYSLALIAWEMLTLRPLFGVTTRRDWWSGHRHVELLPEALAPADRLSRSAIDAVFRTALAVRPEERFRAARDLIDQLLRATDSPVPHTALRVTRVDTWETQPLTTDASGGQPTASSPDGHLPITGPVPSPPQSQESRPGTLPVAVAPPRSVRGDPTAIVGAALATILVACLVLAIIL